MLRAPDAQTFFFALVVSTIGALVVFRHAERHGNRHATAWGIAVFLFVAFALPLYFLRQWLNQRRR